MNLSSYKPQKNKYIVYQNEKSNTVGKLNGIVTSFLLALINDYHFRISDDDKDLLDLFDSENEWSNEDWISNDLYFGRLNLNNILETEKHWLENVILPYELSNSDVIKLLINQNGLKYIFNNENYVNRLEELGLEYNTAFSVLLTHLFKFNKKYKNNFDFLIDKLFENNSKPLSIHIDTTNIDEETISLFIDAIKKHSSPTDVNFIMCDDEIIVDRIKTEVPSLKVVTLPKGIDNEYVKTYYNLFLQSNCVKHIISYWSDTSKIITAISTDDVVIVENKNYPQLKNKVEGYRKAKLNEILDII